MKHIINQCLAAILSVAMAFSLLPAAAMAEESGEAPEQATVEQVQALIDTLPDADTITADNRADVEAQLTAIDEAKLELTEDEAAALDTTRYDAAVAALSALDTQTADPDPEPGALEQVQALIDALPDADTITAENRDDVEAQLTAIDEAKLALEDEELDTLDTTRYMAAVEAILALDDMAGADEPVTIAMESDITYLDWDDGQKRLVEKTCDSATKVESSTTTWDNNWYVVSGRVTISDRIIVTGTVHLILMDGCALTASKGIQVYKDNSLTIYGQSAQTGSLSAIATSANDAGIGGGYWEKSGTITINGGNITAQSSSTDGAGIGGGGYSWGGTTIINGGSVIATGSDGGAGIGGGWNGSGGTITINGGSVTATGGKYGTGIGGGYYAGAGTITINGGSVTATGGEEGAVGIGKGLSGSEGSFSTGTNGNAVIVASSISDVSKRSSWSGIIIDGDSGEVHGTPTPKYNFEIPSGKTLNVKKDHPLHIASDVTMTNKGIINIGTKEDMNAVLNNEGEIINEGTIDVWGQLTHGEDGIRTQNSGQIIYHFNLDVDAPTFEEAKYGYLQPQAQKITITNNGQVDANITSVNIDGSGFELITGNIGNVTKGGTNESWSVQPKAGLSVGTHTATITVTYSGSGGSSKTATATVMFTVIKASATVEAPQAKEDLTYNGTDQALVTAGSVNGVNGCGEMQYSLTEGSNFSTTIPTGKDADTYTVYWQVTKDETNFNYTGETSGSVEVTISKTASKIEASAVTVTYGENIKLTATVNGIGVSGISLMSAAAENKVKFTFANGTSLEAPVTYKDDSRKDSGTAEVTIAANKVKDYLDPGSNEVTVSYGGSGNLNEKDFVKMTVTVNPKTLTFTFNAQNKTYDGSATIDGTFDALTGQLVSGDDVAIGEYTATADDANAGQNKEVEVKVSTLTGEDAEYYTPGTAAGGTVTISKATVKFDVSGNSLSYTGSDQKAMVTKTAPVGLELAEATDYEVYYTAQNAENTTGGTKDGKTDAGTYDVWVKLTKDTYKNYMFADDKQEAKVGELTISKVLATCVAPTANNSTYTGGTQALVGAGAHTGGTMMYALGESGSVEPGDEKFSETIPSETDAGKYYVWYYVKADTNHTDSAKGYVEVTIKKAEVTFTVTGNDVPYDTNAHTATVTQTENESPKLSPTDFSVTYGPDKTANKTNVGEYDIYVTLKNNNFKFEGQEDTVREMELSDKLTINQAELTLTIDPVTITYGDELADTLLSGKATIDGDTEIPGTWAWQEQRDTYPKPSDASHNYVAVFTPDDPYKGNFEPSTLQKTVTITVNRKTLTPSIDTVKNIDQFSGETDTTGTLTLTGAVLSESPTATGTFNFDTATAGTNKPVSVTGITLSGSWSDNYELSVDHLNGVATAASIGKRVVTLEWKLNGADNFTVTYSGKAVNVAATVTNLVSGYDCTVTVTDGGKTDAGTYTAKAALSDTNNYTLPTNGNEQQAYTIAKSVVTFVEHNGTATYDTQPHQVTLTNTVTGGAPELQPSDYTVHYAASGQDFETGAETETKAGEYDVYVKLSNETFANYEFKGKAQTANVGTLKVEQAKLELTVKDVTITYGTALNNAQLTGSTAKIEGENGATITGTWSWANEGDFPAVSDSKSTNYKVTFTPDSDYVGNFVEETLSTETTITVNRYVLTPVVVASSVDSKTYDGNTTVTGGELEFTDMGIFNNAPFNGTKPTISGAFAYTSPNAGTNTVNVTGIHFDKNGENYSLSTDKIDSSAVGGAIAAKEVTLSWALDGGAELTTGYTGAEHTVTATATTGVGSETVNVTVTGGTQTNAGSYTATASGLTNGENGGLAANYKLPSDVTQEYTVTPAPVSFTVGAEDKVDWATRGEKNEDPNPTGYALEGSGTEYALSMTYDSYNHKAAVTQKAGEAVKIEAGTTNGYTVTYRKDGAGDDLTEIRDAGTYEIWVTLTPTEDNIYNYAFTGHEGNRALKIGAITVEPYETAVSWTHLKYVYHGHAMHPDIHVLSPFKADDVQMSGGLPADFDHEHPEAYTGDYLVAFAETGDSVVGSYTVTAKLYGKNAGNYTVTDLTEDVTIIPAPVTILVGDNTWVMQEDGTLSRNTVTLRPTWGAVTAAPDQDEGTDHQYPAAGSAITAALDMTVEYRKDGETVVGAPTEPGTYEVWVTIGNNNFRHSAATDGAPHNVGELVVTDRPESISTYTVTFDPGYEGAPAGPAELSGIFANQTVVIPPISGENEDGTRYDLTRPGYSFLGWSYDGRIYQPNEELYMPAADVTFTAEWTDAVALNGQILRESGSGDPVPVSGATVVLKHGSEEVAETVTDRSGAFDFGRVTPGIYNLEVTCENGSDAKIVKTFLVVLEDGGIVGGEYILPDVALNTVVEVIPSITAAVDMGGIVSGEDIVDVYTSEDRETVRSGGTVEFKMSISGAELTPDQTQELPVPEDRIGMALDLELTKTVSKRGGDSTEIDIHDTKIPVSTAIHLPAELQGKSGYTVYRFHDTDGDGIDEMQTITTSPNENGEYLEVIREGTAIELHAEFYSTYVLTWNQITNSSYRVTLPAATANGRLTADRTMASRGRTVTLTATPDEGCHLRSLTVTDKNGKPVELTAGGDGTYTFVQPASRVTVEAEFVKCLSMDYTDIDLDAWCHEYTDRVIESGLMLGVGDGVFAPNGTVTRAQMVTALWHMSGDAETDYDMDYTDVSEGDWYAEAVRWATGAGVAGGYGNGKFGPNDPITREQMATMLYRYEQNLGDGGFTGEWMYRLPFTDIEDISDWAFEAVAWCNMEEIVLGRENDTFDPQGEAKRSEMAAILTRWSGTNEK